MAGIKGKSGGRREGAGRKTLKTEREIKEQLQKLVPDAFAVIQSNLKSETGKKFNTQDAWKVLDKFVPDRKSSEISIEETKPLEIRIVSGGFEPPTDSSYP